MNNNGGDYDDDDDSDDDDVGFRNFMHMGNQKWARSSLSTAPGVSSEGVLLYLLERKEVAQGEVVTVVVREDYAPLRA